MRIALFVYLCNAMYEIKKKKDTTQAVKSEIRKPTQGEETKVLSRCYTDEGERLVAQKIQHRKQIVTAGSDKFSLNFA